MDNVDIGKGRQSWCACLNRGSADCVRFHIAENRTKVKHMLGPLFYKWKFDHMGEEALVSSWSLEEESEFKSLVIKARQELTDKTKSRHETMSNFWRRASESIPSKTKDVLVSYYFNKQKYSRVAARRDTNPIRSMCLYIDAEEHELGDLGELANYKAALLDSESDKWLNAMNVEMQSMKDNGVWDLVELLSNGKIVGRKWFFKKKTDMDGASTLYSSNYGRRLYCKP
ncbi:hypothetical protein Tco_0616084 [Tanacetum coccineum]